MSVLNKAWFLVGAGFLAGSAGLKLLASKPAKKLYVQGVAAGLRAKNCYEEVVEEAKASVDDIVAEANYLNDTKDADEIEVEVETETVKKTTKKAASAKKK